MKTIRVGLAGCGTVGAGVWTITQDRRAALAERAGVQFDIVRAVVRDPAKPRSVAIDPAIVTDDPDTLLADDIDLVVEVIGGTTTARDVVVTALRAGKPVVTANKALLAEHGAEIFATARTADSCVAFEASVAGGLPVVTTILEGLAANRIDRLVGIFNSTCNFILDAMLTRERTFEQAVADAQELGFAEADPTLDVNGTDTLHKLVVLASMGLGVRLDPQRISRTGIDQLAVLDVQAAEALGLMAKLVGVTERVADQPNQLSAYVQPVLLDRNHPLAHVNGSSSGVQIIGDAVGETVYIGAGAGSLPTASAVVADMIAVAHGVAGDRFGRLPAFDALPEPEYAPYTDRPARHYVRLIDCPTQHAPADVRVACKDVNLALERTEYLDNLPAMVLITEPLGEHQLRNALHTLLGVLGVPTKPAILRILDADASAS